MVHFGLWPNWPARPTKHHPLSNHLTHQTKPYHRSFPLHQSQRRSFSRKRKSKKTPLLTFGLSTVGHSELRAPGGEAWLPRPRNTSRRSSPRAPSPSSRPSPRAPPPGQRRCSPSFAPAWRSPSRWRAKLGS